MARLSPIVRRAKCPQLLLLLLPLLLPLATGFASSRWLITGASTAQTTGSPQQPCRQSHIHGEPRRASNRGDSGVTAPNNLLEQVQRRTTVWADTADLSTVEQLNHDLGLVDVTTNPSIVAATALQGAGSAGSLLVQTPSGSGAASKLESHERIAVDIGRRLLQVVPGRVCTQLDIRCTDAENMVKKARGLVSTYSEAGIPRERVLIKTPATWAGIRATERLEREGIRCLVTLVCSRVQGQAAAEAGASIIATYVGRVSDWHKKAAASETTGGAPAPPGTANAPASCASEDPGVTLTTDLKDYFVSHGLPTEVMGASFRSADQVEALAGCDHLTIAPRLITEMARLPPRVGTAGVPTSGNMPPEQETRRPSEPMNGNPSKPDEESFLAALGRDTCGTEVLRSSVEGFARDTAALEAAVAKAER
ncbi:transaldolase B [Ectocarpus siliculosus]|uniref:Transaldolase B n=1 Tax=Ectocarpus siliculosus TaxID=2880 RepID=D8LMM8_ECTSI|nr:transaldolase B [Ectocarpus siliculosus]|eukprot:CBN79725.1 transaldolase B [Ectocarpus siliculosus]